MKNQPNNQTSPKNNPAVNLETINYKLDDIFAKIDKIEQNSVTEERIKVWDMERDRKLDRVEDELKTYKAKNDNRWAAYDMAAAEREKRSSRQYIVPILIGMVGIVLADAVSPLIQAVAKIIFK